MSNKTQFNNLLQKFAAFKPLGLSTSVKEHSPCPSGLSLSIGGNQQAGGKAELAHVVMRLSSKYRWRFTEQYKDGNRPPFGAPSEYTPAVLSDPIRVASDGTTWMIDTILEVVWLPDSLQIREIWELVSDADLISISTFWTDASV
ncbi:hypothetical protein C8024_08780 [Sphingopyxis sp. BSNA05]|nr:hypothetical protein [Sphingopyxis sp. BSNA05]